jgi:hypothetical protein
MSDWWVWPLLAAFAIPMSVWLFVPLGDASGFWSNLYEHHPHGACSLWGFTHIFGPRLENTSWWPQAFEKRYGVPPPPL